MISPGSFPTKGSFPKSQIIPPTKIKITPKLISSLPTSCINLIITLREDLTKNVYLLSLNLMAKIISWIKANKLTALLLLIIIWLGWKVYFPPYRYFNRGGIEGGIELDTPLKTSSVATVPFSETPPAPEVKERLVFKESTLSLLVKKVTEAQKLISQKAEEFGGYFVQSDVFHPEEKEATSGSITVRVPQKKLNEALDYFRSLAVKVISENLSGWDVTDEYVDIEARLATLNKTKVKFEEILTKAEKVEDILSVQRELINLQEQIDSLKGRQQYLEKSAEISRVTIYLSTDELALPYTPTEVWRPKVIFKQAVRSLIGTARKAGTTLIWIGVYSVFWVPILIIYLIFRRRKKSP